MAQPMRADRCVVCRYDTSGLPDANACPECATPIVATRYGVRLRHREPRFLRSLVIGACIGVAGSVLASGGVVLVLMLPLLTERVTPESTSVEIGTHFMRFGAMIWVVGLLLLASRERGVLDRRIERALDSPARGATRAFAWASLGVGVYVLLVEFASHRLALSSQGQTVVVITLVTTLFIPLVLYHLQWFLIGRLARRCGRERLAVCSVLLDALAGVLNVVVLVLPGVVTRTPGDVILVGWMTGIVVATVALTPGVMLALLARAIVHEGRSDSVKLHALLRPVEQAATDDTAGRA